MDLFTLILFWAVNLLFALGFGFWIALGFCRGLQRARLEEIRVTPDGASRAFRSQFLTITLPLCAMLVLLACWGAFAAGMGTDVEWGFYPPAVVALRALDVLGLLLTPLLLFLSGCILLAPRLTNAFLLALMLVPATALLMWGLLWLGERLLRDLVITGTDQDFFVHIGFYPMGGVSLLVFTVSLIWARRQGVGWFGPES